ncbi:MAG: hypothetical protein WCD69_23230, partial [Xanthobacteraceae bacterium]
PYGILFMIGSWILVKIRPDRHLPRYLQPPGGAPFLWVIAKNEPLFALALTGSGEWSWRHKWRDRIHDWWFWMMFARFLPPIVGVCLLAACATPRWVKTGASESNLAQDRQICMRALQEPPSLGMTNQQTYEQCMSAHGWKLQQ